MAAMPDSLLIPVAKADIGRRLDQLLLVLVVLAIAVAWTAEPGRPLRFIAFALLLGLSWWVPRALNGSRRNTTCNPGSLCATARIQYRQPVALRLHGDGTLFVQWEAEGPWLVARQPRTLWLGPLLHLAVDTLDTSDPGLSTESPRRSLESGSAPEAQASMPSPGAGCNRFRGTFFRFTGCHPAWQLPALAASAGPDRCRDRASMAGLAQAGWPCPSGAGCLISEFSQSF